MMSGMLNILISGIITSVLTIYTVLCFLDKKKYFYRKQTILSILIYCSATVFLYYMTDNVIRVIFNILILNMCIYIILKKDMFSIFITTIIYIIFLIFSEFIYAIIVLQLINYNLDRVKEICFASIVGNFFIYLMTYFILNQKSINKILKNIFIINKSEKKKIIIFDFVVFGLMLILVLYYSYFKFTPFQNFLFSFIIIVFLTMILFQYINVQTNNCNLAFQYNISEERLKDTENILNKYRKVNHENINQLIALKGMLNNHEDTENYINLLLNRNKVFGINQNDKDFKVKINKLPFEDMKTLILYKCVEMKENNILLSVNINGLENLLDNNNNLDLNTRQNICELLGIYIDNACDAVINLARKEIFLDIYVNDDYLYIELSNNFFNNIKQSNVNGVLSTTKGKDHGNGLLIANEIIEKNKKISSSIVINGNIYTQKLKINYRNKKD